MAGHDTIHRTPAPSDWEQATILMKRNLRNDINKKTVWFARLFLGPLMYMLYCLGFLFYDRPQTSFTVEGGYRLYEAEPLVYPETVYFGTSLPSAATSATGAFLKTVQNEMAVTLAQAGDQYKVVSNGTVANATDFQTYCQDELGDERPDQKVCVFLDSQLSYNIYFGADQSVSPYEDALVGTQYAVQSALLTANGLVNAKNNNTATIRHLQALPTLDAPARSTKPGLYFLIFPGVMLLLASAIQMQFFMAPLSVEKFKEIARSFFLVGVKPRVYLQQWLVYLSLNAGLTAATYAGVFYGWNIVTQSNLGLLFCSNYLNMIHIISFGMYFTQVINQEELTQSVPWFFAIFSAGASIAILVLDNNYAHSIVFSILAVFSPFCAMMQFCAIYLTYDVFGYQGGIHPGFNVYESGLLASLLAQAAGILFWNALTLLYVRPHAAKPKASPEATDGQEAVGEPLDVDRFEPLPPTAEVLLRVTGLGHTFEPPRCQSRPPVEVLNGLDLEICRGEVFSYLGHNSSGKTTSIKILTGELPLQSGTVSYHLKSGDATLTSTSDLDRIRRNVGICPQHNDALHGDVSAREFLRLFAYLKGRVPQPPGQSKEDAIEAEVERRLDEIKFTSSEDADKPIETYSGGMKRKVCIALAFLSDPEVVCLDEPTAGLDPYNRRQVWDMIIAAKAGRSIILTTHFLDEADVLSDRVGILKGGHLIARGSTLFLKHKIGGYGLRYDASEPIDISKFVVDAKHVEAQRDGSFQWELSHGSEASFSTALRALDEHGATNVSLELTSLEQVFLETGREVTDTDESLPDGDPAQEAEISTEQVKRIWELRGTKSHLKFTSKFLLVSNFMFTNAWKVKGLIMLNIIQPLIYVVASMVLLSKIDTNYDKLVVRDPILMSPYIAGGAPSSFFGVTELSNYPMGPISPADAPMSVGDLFGPGSTFIGGFYAGNQTLQSNVSMSVFAQQLGLQVLGNYTAFLGGAVDGIGTTLIQLPFIAGGFRIDLLLLPLMLALGFAGVVFAMLDILLLKADNIVSIFRVNGITQWSTYTGVILYKVVTSFCPFFCCVIILGFALQSLLMGSSGRWLGTILVMLAYAWSSAPLGVLIAERFIKKDFKRAANIFPGVYMTLVSLPYIAWSIAQQNAPGAQEALMVIGDFLLLIPPVAFQRAIGAVLAVSTEYDDPDLTWAIVWSWESRIWFSILMMFLVGTLEWVYLYHLTTKRPPVTYVKNREHTPAVLTDYCNKNFGVEDEVERSLVDDEGINARNLVKVFRIKPSKNNKKNVLKQAVKGASFGVRKGEIYAVVGPNGAGKSTTMAMLAGELTPEQGEISLSGKKLTGQDRCVNHLFEDGNVAFCPQFDALFPHKTVREHLIFYATVRGLDLRANSTIDHVDAIVRLLGLGNHLDKLSTDISGGYKRRTCLAISMIGFPSVMMVDECTTGLDPGARHLVWETLKPDMDGVCLPAILLSTHYMDEASRLGDRIGIFVDGELVSTGSLPDLQAEYCRCYFVEVALKPSAPADGIQKTLAAFDAIEMPVHLYESLPFHFKLKVDFEPHSRVVQLARIFELLEENREALRIQFYSVAQMNLEAILLDLSRRQFEVEESTRNLSTVGSHTV